MRRGTIVYVERYYDNSYGGHALSMKVAIKRKTIFGRTKIESDSLYGYRNDDLKVGDKVYYDFDKWGISKSYVIKQESE